LFGLRNGSGRRSLGAPCAASNHLTMASQQSGVRPDEWRHGLDATNTSLLNTVLPLAGDVMKHVVAPAAERQLRLSHLGGALCVGPTQLPWLWQLQCEASAALLGQNCRVPALYLRNVPGANAYTLAFRGHAPAVVLHTDTLETLTADEVKAVLAHELGHIACEHGVWLNVARLVSMPFAGGAPGGPLPAVVGATLSRWSRAAELSCDRAALLVSRHPDIVVSALMKLVGGSPKIASQLNLAAFRAQAASLLGSEAPSEREGLMDWFVDAAASALVPHNSIHDLLGAAAAATSFGQDHPSAVARAAEVDRWAGSAQYRALLARMPR
jgi:Zn-dependent protease with chaperone function